MVELTGIINTDFMSKCQGTCKILVSNVGGIYKMDDLNCVTTTQFCPCALGYRQ